MQTSKDQKIYKEKCAGKKQFEGIPYGRVSDPNSQKKKKKPDPDQTFQRIPDLTPEIFTVTYFFF